MLCQLSYGVASRRCNDADRRECRAARSFCMKDEPGERVPEGDLWKALLHENSCTKIIATREGRPSTPRPIGDSHVEAVSGIPSRARLPQGFR